MFIVNIMHLKYYIKKISFDKVTELLFYVVQQTTTLLLYVVRKKNT